MNRMKRLVKKIIFFVSGNKNKKKLFIRALRNYDADSVILYLDMGFDVNTKLEQASHLEENDWEDYYRRPLDYVDYHMEGRDIAKLLRARGGKSGIDLDGLR